ncbi:MAG TPA: cell division protein FtsA [Tenuifilaceae bacterium]|nr:cell division protein FtsA [Tenuifilaceae bacterium]HPE17617.1 cell division protein FtsA [Tenuifilaceae bacterium]HPJ44980.1 cell division protein FtsA [Tenuifilaceae bacterium]HPQ33773.1 cell division protein FtsA [Tenuifilaceae bacterium]HRX67665.1 cell division protein FtsA [Tenuifilaceae bacterium]
MANQNEYVAAIDLGTTKIVSIVGKKNPNGKLQIVAHSKAQSTGIKRGVVLNIEETVASIQRTVEEVQLKSGIILGEVFVGIAGQHIRSVRNRGYINRDTDDVIGFEDVQKLIDDMFKIPTEVGEEILHVLPQNFIVDNESGIKNPIGMSGRRLEANFHIVIGKTSSAKNIEKCVDRVGLKVNDLILEPLASAEAVLTEDEKEAGVVLVDIGGGTTDVAVYYEGIVRHTAVIPFGGNVITNDIKEGCSILPRQAESLKIQFGSALGDLAPDDKIVTIPGISGREPKEISFKSLAYIIQSRMEEIIDTVYFEIENSGFAEKLSAGIVLTGGGALLKHLSQLVKFKTGYDVRIGFPTEQLAADFSEEINLPMFSTSVGLVLKGFEHIETLRRMNQDEELVQNEFEEEKVVQQEKTNIRKLSVVEKFKQKFTEIFEVNDSEM